MLSSKIKSRKLWAWLVYTGLVIYCLIKGIDNGLIDQYWLVTATYIGGNVFQKSLK